MQVRGEKTLLKAYRKDPIVNHKDKEVSSNSKSIPVMMQLIHLAIEQETYIIWNYS